MKHVKDVQIVRVTYRENCRATYKAFVEKGIYEACVDKHLRVGPERWVTIVCGIEREHLPAFLDDLKRACADNSDRFAEYADGELPSGDGMTVTLQYGWSPNQKQGERMSHLRTKPLCPLRPPKHH